VVSGIGQADHLDRIDRQLLRAIVLSHGEISL